MEVDESYAGRPTRCAVCGTDIRIPKGGETQVAQALDEPSKPGALVVHVGDETVEVVPPVDTMAILSVALLTIAAAVTVGLGLAGVTRYPWTIGTTLGASVALLAGLTGLPAYHGIRRSKGRKRGKVLALIGAIGGGAVFVGLAAVAAALWFYNIRLQPTCDENLERINRALRAYAEDHDGVILPPALGDLVEEGYLESQDTLICPESGVMYTMHFGRLNGKRIPIDLDNPLFEKDLLIVSDGVPMRAHADGFARVLLLDGTVHKVPVEDWEMYRAEHSSEKWDAIFEKLREQDKPVAETGREEDRE
jgi:hypothetical protein